MKRILIFVLMLAASAAHAQTGLQLVEDINPGAGSSTPAQLTEYNGSLYFMADDGVHGKELWTYSGTGKSSMVYDLNPGRADAALGFYGGSFQPMVVFRNKLYFGAVEGGSDGKLYVYDGVNPPSRAPGFDTFSAGPAYLTAYGSRIYFTSGYWLFAYDGINTPVMVDVNPGHLNKYSYPYELTPFNGKLLFRGLIGDIGHELVEYDTATGTARVVADIHTGQYLGGNPMSLTVLGSSLYFFADDSTHGYELFAYDGATTTRLTDLAPGSKSGIYDTYHAAGVLNGDLYFTGSSDGVKFQLYKYSPAAGAATLVHSFNASWAWGFGDAPQYFSEYSGHLYFTATDTGGTELWRTDGTVTERVADICPDTCDSRPSQYLVFGNRLYFAASSAANGRELYRFTDPAAVSTRVPATSIAYTVRVYPNPVREHAVLELTLPASEVMDISLSDMSGRVVWAAGAVQYAAGANPITLPTGDLPGGVYFYRITNSAGAPAASGRLVVR